MFKSTDLFNASGLFNALSGRTNSQSTLPSKVEESHLHSSKIAAPHSLSPLQQRVVERIETCYHLAEAKLNRRFPRPTTQFSLRGKSAGTAHLQQNKLRFNPILLSENCEAFMQEVVPHEICHLLCFQLFGKTKPHGKEWQSLMLSVFALNPSTTHSFNVASVAGREVDYHCACGPIKLSIRRHNKVVRGENRYLCKRCKTHLTPA